MRPIYKKEQEIKNIQRRTTRMIPELKGLYTDRLSKLKLFSMGYRRKEGRYDTVVKLLNGFENIDAQTMFTFSSSTTKGGTLRNINRGV